MGKWVHRLSNIDEINKLADCAECGSGVNIGPSGSGRWRCSLRKSLDDKLRKRPYAKHKKDECENSDCTATIDYSFQLDVHHIDGNHKNNNPSNLLTLCANCHRIETYLEGHHLSQY